MVSFAVQKLVSLIRFHLFIFVFIGWLTWENIDMIMLDNVLPMFSFRSFMVSCLMFKSSSYFEFIFVYGERECILTSLIYMYFTT